VSLTLFKAAQAERKGETMDETVDPRVAARRALQEALLNVAYLVELNRDNPSVLRSSASAHVVLMHARDALQRLRVREDGE
jgi:hypothetical protein